MEDFNRAIEENLLRSSKEKEKADKLLLNVEAWVAFGSIVLFVWLVMVV